MTDTLAKYAKAYPHLVNLIDKTLSGDKRAAKTLGDAVARLAYPAGISGREAYAISKIGL